MPAVVVIGGGAAGISAARVLWDAGVDVLLVEAGTQLGGRARSVMLPLPLPALPSTVAPAQAGASASPVRAEPVEARARYAPLAAGHALRQAQGERNIDHLVTLDLGCGWLHSARRNPWTELATRYGFTVDHTPANWRGQYRDLGFPPADQQVFAAAWTRWDTAAHAALNGPDRPLADFIAPADPWRPMIDAISGYANGAPLAQVSLHDWANYEDAATDDNWAVEEGYGTLVQHHAADMPHRLDTIVTRIDHSGKTIRLDTNRGTIEADRVIVCVPTTTLACEEIVFSPPLPAKQAAAAALPLGLADKVFLHVADAEVPRNGHLIGNPYTGKTASYRLAPFGQPVIESFFGGDCAEALEQAGEGAAAAFAIDELVALLGNDWRAKLTPLAATRWRAEPHIHGSYSHATIGGAPQRAFLAEPIDDRLFFAGEACSKHDFSTAHGAYDTGVVAARAILAQRKSASLATADPAPTVA